MSEVNLENLSKKELIGIIKNIKEEHPEIKIKLLVDNNLNNNKQTQSKNDNLNSDKINVQNIDFNHLNFII